MADYEPPTPFTNADFRKMLQTPRARPTPTPSRQPSQGGAGYQAAKKQEAKARKPPKPHKPHAGKTKDEEKKDGPVYRDRAAERREGKLGEYEHIAEELPTILQTRGLVADPANLSIEQSKYLGGDVEHTHLVKGLDYALLQKERMRVEAEKEKQAKEAVKKEARGIKKEDLQIHSSLARGVVEALFNPPRRDLKEMFQPRRTAFVYDLAPEDPWAATDIPTTLHRSKADCPQVVDAMLGAADSGVLQRISQLLGQISFTGGAGKKLKRREREALLFGSEGPKGAPVDGAVLKGSMAPAAKPQQQAKRAPADDDDDIFGDAGTDYKPRLPKERAGGSGLARKKDTYFDKKDDMADIPVPASAKPRGPGATADDLEEGEVAPPPPPPLPPSYHNQSQSGYPGLGPQYGPQGGQYGPAPGPPPGAHAGYMDPDAYEAYIKANAQYQASMDPEYQALLAKQQGLVEDEAPGPSGRAAGSRPGELTQQEKDAGMASVFKADGERWRVARPRAGVVAAEEDALDDAYAECYPSYHHTGAEVVDSDGEDLEGMEGKGKGLGRADFQTEEEWQQYKSLKEANPKAAYQFGVKAADGRKKPKNLDKARDQKLSTQLQKIEGILKEKGQYSEAAFRGRPESDALDAPTPMRAKRMRI